MAVPPEVPHCVAAANVPAAATAALLHTADGARLAEFISATCDRIDEVHGACSSGLGRRSIVALYYSLVLHGGIVWWYC
jgi:hypothetical protein